MAASIATQRDVRGSSAVDHAKAVAGPVSRRTNVRLVETGNGRGPVVELTSSLADNPIYRTYRSLRDLGVQVVHAEIRPVRDGVVQKLHLTLCDGSALDQRHLSDVLTTLNGRMSLAHA
jgi:hypothetical protein